MGNPTGHHRSQATATDGGLGGPTSVTKAQLGAGVRSTQAPDQVSSPSSPIVPVVEIEEISPSITTITTEATEPDDFEVFFDQVFPRAIRVARRLVGDPAEAEDLAAEAFARAYARWPSVRRHAAPEGWVLRATINLAIDSLRKGKRTPELATVDGPEDIIALRMTLAAAMGSLSRRQREIVSLRYLADLSEQDVAAALAITPGSVKTHLSRALDRMRRVMGPQVEEVADGLHAT